MDDERQCWEKYGISRRQLDDLEELSIDPDTLESWLEKRKDTMSMTEAVEELILKNRRYGSPSRCLSESQKRLLEATQSLLEDTKEKRKAVKKDKEKAAIAYKIAHGYPSSSGSSFVHGVKLAGATLAGLLLYALHS